MLSTRCRYALHALVYLAGKQAMHPVRVSEIADAYRLPRKFLESILSDLKKGGILESKRGQQGGYRLAKSPQHIRLSDIVRLLDGPILLSPCSHDTICDECAGKRFCHLRNAFQSINRSTESKLDGVLLAGLVRSKSTVKSSRKMHAASARRKP